MASTTANRTTLWWHWVLLGVALIIVGLSWPKPDLLRHWLLEMGSSERINALDPGDAITKVIEVRVDLSKTLFQTTLLVIAGIWSLVLAKRDEAKVIFESPVPILLFVCANVLLLFAAMSHIDFVVNATSLLITGARLHKVPDLDSAFVFSSLTSQLIRIALALVVTGIMMICAHWK